MKNIIDKVIKLYKKYEEIIMYLIMGVLATIVNLIVKLGMLYTFLDAANDIHVQIAVVTSWIVACTFAYFTNRIFVFKSKNKNILQEIKSKKILKEFISFVGARIITLLVDMLIMFIFVTLLKMNSDLWVFIWTIVSQIVVIILNYIFSKLFIFKKDRDRK